MGSLHGADTLRDEIEPNQKEATAEEKPQEYGGATEDARVDRLVPGWIGLGGKRHALTAAMPLSPYISSHAEHALLSHWRQLP